MILERVSHDEHDTQELGRRVGALLRGGEVLALEGDLGAGKTVFVRGLAGGLALDGDVVYSPSFTLVAEHPGRIPLVHIDLFRLGDPVSVEDFEEIGLREHLDPTGVTAIEWASRLPASAAEMTLRVVFEELSGNERRIRLIAPAAAGERILKGLEPSIR